MSTTAELLATFNEMRTATGSKPLKAWKESRAKLEAAIAAWPATSTGSARDFEATEVELAAQADRAKVQAAKRPNLPDYGTEVTDSPFVRNPPAPKAKRITKDVEFKDSARKTKKGDVWLTELCETYSLNPKVARAKMRRLYDGDTKGLPTLLGRWSWSSNDTAAVVKLLKK